MKWNPYPLKRPQKEGRYLIAGGDKDKEWLVAYWNGNRFLRFKNMGESTIHPNYWAEVDTRPIHPKRLKNTLPGFEEYYKYASKSSVYGVSVDSMTKEELFAAIGLLLVKLNAL